ncbi:MAG: prolyl oligopeptidase family serine peptidase [Phycisphaerales bacterium]
MRTNLLARVCLAGTVLSVSTLAFTGAALGQGVAGGGNPPGMEVKGKGKPLIAPSAATVEQFTRISAPQRPSIAPDGTIYFRERQGTVYQVFTRAAGGGPDAPMTQLTDFADGAGGYSVSPDGKRLLVTAAPGGNEQTQVYVIDAAAVKAAKSVKPGEFVKPVLINPKVQYGPGAWLRDSSGFVFRANDEKPKDYSLYVHSFADGKSTRILSKEGSWSAAAITDDAKRVLVEKYISISQSEVYELDVASGELKDLSFREKGGAAGRGGGAAGSAAPAVSNSVVGYTPDEKSVILQSDIEDGKMGLFVRDLASGTTKRIGAQWAKFEIDGAGLSDTRELLAVATNEDGYGVLRMLSVPLFEELRLPQMDKGVVSVADLRGRKLLYTVNNVRTPGITFMTEISPAGTSTTPVAVTKADTQGIDLSGFALPELVTYESFDKVKIPAFVYLPKDHKKGTAIPFIINYHGGPEGQHRPVFSGGIQLYVSRGFGVMMPNVRGSTGYGREFHMMDNYKKRWDSVKDGVEAARWLVSNGYAEAGKIAAQGGSYGGFMTVAVLVEDGEAFEKAGGEKGKATRLFGAGANTVGIVNFKTFLEQTADYRRALREAEYGPLSDSEFLTSVSPIHRMSAVNVPMMIIHGLNDPRVPVGEAMQLAVGLQKRGMEPEQIYFHDEGHGAQKLDNRILSSERQLKFFQKTIGR